MWLEEEWEGRVRHGLKLRERLFDQRSPWQRVEIVDTLAYGKALVLDGVWQTSVADEFIYHEMISHPALCLAPRLSRVLVVGGGDGGTVREVLRHGQVERVDMVEIDALVVRACRRHLPEIGSAWSDSRLRLHFADAAAFVKEAHEASYDAILVDGSDPVGPSESLFGFDFFRDCRRILTPGGLYVMQSGSPFLTPRVFAQTVRGLAESFGQARPCFASVPLYAAGPWSFTLAAEGFGPARLERVRSFKSQLRYYDPEQHAAAFLVPPYLRDLLCRP